MARSTVVTPPAEKRTAPTLLLGRLGLLCLGLFTPFLLLEVGLRLAGPFLPGEYQTAAFTAPSDLIGRQNRPNTAGWTHTREFSTWVRVNSKGLRGPEVDYAKPSDTFRILVLGDSFTFALQVEEEQTFVERLAEELNAAGPPKRIETINAGVDGWSTVNEYAWLLSEGYRYEPDLVLVMFFVGNDPGDNAEALESPADIGRLRLGADPGSPIEAARQALRSTSVAFNVFEQGVVAKLWAGSHGRALADQGERDDQGAAAARQLLGIAPDRRLRSTNSQDKLRGWMIAEALLVRMRYFAGQRGMKLAVVGIPNVASVRSPAARTTPLSAVSARAGLPLIDLLDSFRLQPKRLRERLYFEKNRHWTADGHALAARAVAAELRGLRLVPEEPSSGRPG